MMEKKEVVKKKDDRYKYLPTDKKSWVKTDKDRALVSRLLSEALVAYRQPKVKDDDELMQRFDEYFRMCAETGQIPTVEEMALNTGFSDSTVWDWETGRRKGFSPRTAEIVKSAKAYLKTFDAKLVVSGKLNFLTYCFRAKNYYGMVDKQEMVLTPNNPLGNIENEQEIRKRLTDGTIEV